MHSSCPAPCLHVAGACMRLLFMCGFCKIAAMPNLLALHQQTHRTSCRYVIATTEAPAVSSTAREAEVGSEQSASQVVMEVSGDSSVTAVDVAEHPVVGPLAAGRGELTGLALWLMAERHQVSRDSVHQAA